jgi:hypothetical protein
MKFDELNEDNYLFFAIKHYDNPQAVTKEDFFDDIKRFKYLKRLLKMYVKSRNLKLHLILNHMIVIYNVFGDAATPLLFYKTSKEYWSILKSFMIYLNRYPEIHSVLDDIPLDKYCTEELQKL